jgi:hypothetical protein
VLAASDVHQQLTSAWAVKSKKHATLPQEFEAVGAMAKRK